MKWINVKDGVPPKHTDLCLLTDSGIIQGNYVGWEDEYSDTDNWEFISLDVHGCGCCSYDTDVVTHWMLLTDLGINKVKI
jgi:hypothetical protein